MNLKELKSLIENKSVEVRERMSKVDAVTMNQYRLPYGEDIELSDKFLVNAPHEYTVEELMAEVETLDAEILTLKSILAEKNQKTKFAYKGKTLTLATAIVQLKAMRSMLPLVRRLANNFSEQRDVQAPSRYSEDTKTYVVVRKPTFEAKVYREKLKELENDIIELQSLMDVANLSVKIVTAD